VTDRAIESLHAATVIRAAGRTVGDPGDDGDSCFWR
jgi:hypothetical protein